MSTNLTAAPTVELYEIRTIIKSTYAHYIIYGSCFLGLLWALFNIWIVTSVKVDAANVKPNTSEKDKANPEMEHMPWTAEECTKVMLQTSDYIKLGSKTFLKKEYTFLSIWLLFFSLVVLIAVDQPWRDDHTYKRIPYTMIAYIIGALTSMSAGMVGMIIATSANVKVTYLCNFDQAKGLRVAYSGGQVLGFFLVSASLAVINTIILAYKPSILWFIGTVGTKQQIQGQVRLLFSFVSGYGMGGSNVALFGRVGGGIYTKAADVGADLAGKVGEHLEEDSPLNPGTIADNVGDNVGDIAGMAADLFGSMASSTCSALVVSSTSWPLMVRNDAVYFPLIITSCGLISSLISVQFVHLPRLSVPTKLRIQLIVSAILTSSFLIPVLWILPPQLDIQFANVYYKASRGQIYGCMMMGLWSGLVIGLSTEYFCSTSYSPVQGLARACLYDAATNIIKGLALGYMSNVIPICCLSLTVLLAFKWGAMYGVALAALGMLGTLPVCLSVDGFGPIADNAGGIAEMSNLDPSVREATDELDAAGNTTAAIGKGFAIGSALLVALALFGAFITRVSVLAPTAYDVNILDPWCFSGLLFGSMIPYLFSSFCMSAVGEAAEEMITEIRDQVPRIKRKEPGYPNHERCVAIATTASLKKMIAPAALVVISPILWGILLGYKFVSGMLAGNICSGIQIAFSASNTGGAWDNAKKYIEAGNLKRPEEFRKAGREGSIVKKGDLEHTAAVCGDTVGDPLKDTSGPAVNILIKLMSMTALVFGSFITEYGGQIGGGIRT